MSYWAAPLVSSWFICLFWLAAAWHYYERPACIEFFNNFKRWHNLLPPVHLISFEVMGSYLALLRMLTVFCASAWILGRALLRRSG